MQRLDEGGRVFADGDWIITQKTYKEMKKLFYLASALMMFTLTACNEGLSDEYKNPAVVSDFTQSLKVFVSKNSDGTLEKQDVVPAGTPIVFTGRVNSKYGPVTAYVRYAVCTPERQEELDLGAYDVENPSVKWQNYWANTATLSMPTTEDGTMVVLPSPVENALFTVTMPGQPAGSVVALRLLVGTPYISSFGGDTFFVVAGADNGDDEGDDEGEDEGDEGDDDSQTEE